MLKQIVFPIDLVWPEPSLFVFVNAFLAVTASAILITLYIRNPWLIARPAFSLAGMVNLLFQWPAVFLSEPVYVSLVNPWWFIFCAHVVTFTSLAWVNTVRSLSIPQDVVATRDVKVEEIAIPLVFAFILSALYFGQMPLKCTAIYALLFDPAYTLLAREVTIKLSGSTLASSSYGALANTVAPFLAAISVALIFRDLRKLSVIVFLWTALLLLSIALVMLAGAKGLAIPLIGLVSVSAVYWTSGIWQKAVAFCAALVFVFAALASFEVIRERGGGSKPYQYAQCVKEVGSFVEGRELLESIRETGGLGLSATRIEDLIAEMDALVPDALVLRSFSEFRRPNSERAATYIDALIQRAFISPLQVAAWHHLYVEEFGSPGLPAAPLAKKLFGESVDTSSLVYMAYGTVFSSGDRTSTSTSPTSFVFSWPAYFGIWGMFLVVIGVLVLDTSFSLVVKRVGQNLLPLAAGLSAVIAFNLSTSDLVVVMLSHGGGIALIVLIGWAIANRRMKSEQET